MIYKGSYASNQLNVPQIMIHCNTGTVYYRCSDPDNLDGMKMVKNTMDFKQKSLIWFSVGGNADDENTCLASLVILVFTLFWDPTLDDHDGDDDDLPSII